MKKLMLIIIFIIYPFLYINCQSESGDEDLKLPEIIPPSPQAMIYQKYLNHRITEYNGLPEVSIPLHEIDIKGLKIPINLSYHASGVKAIQYDGDVGAGWSINVGGYKVMRSIYGKPDEMKQRYNSNHWKTTYSNIHETSPAQQRIEKDLYLNNFDGDVIDGTQDGEYDRFSYILPNTSGNFIIRNGTDRNNIEALIAEGKRDKIIFKDPDNSSSFNNIIITDEQGFCYHLGAHNKYEYYVNQIYKVGWPLIKMITPNNEEVDFEYNYYSTVDNHYEFSSMWQMTEAPFFLNRIPTPTDDYKPGPGYIEGDKIATPIPNSASSLRSQLINKITFPNCTVLFLRKGEYYSNPDLSSRYNWNQLITGIEIYDKNNRLIKKINFDYDLVTQDSHNKHNLLKSISIQGIQTKPQEKYQFTYYPSYSNNGITNEWGYGGGSRVYLDNYFKRFSLLMKRESIGMDEYGEAQYLLPSLGFGDRSINSNPTTNEYSLKRITFPTGGFTEYEYEPHEDMMGWKVGGLRIKKIISKTTENTLPIISEFQYEENEFEVVVGPEDFGDESYTINFFEDEYSFISGYPRLGYKATRTLLFSTKPINSELLSYNPKYGKVTTLQYDVHGNKYNGKTVSFFEKVPFCQRQLFSKRARITRNPDDNAYGNTNFPENGQNLGLSVWIDPYLGYEPVLKSKTYYDNNNNIKKQEEYTYDDIRKGTFQELRVKKKITYNDDYLMREVDIYSFLTTLYDYIEYDLHLGHKRLINKITKDFTENGIVISNESYQYNNRQQLIETIINDYSEQYKYPEDFNDNVYSGMVSKNVLSPVIEKIKFSNPFGIKHETGRIKRNYSQINDIFLPSSLQSKKPNEPSYRTEITYDLYDKKGNLLQYTGPDNVPVSYIWGYINTYPIAEIKNATLDQVRNVLGGELVLDNISNKKEPSESDWTKLKKLYHPTWGIGYVSLFKYLPLVGRIQTTDIDEQNIYYDYDDLGRLLNIRDNDFNLISNYEYHLYDQIIQNTSDITSVNVSGNSACYGNNIEVFTATVTGGSGSYFYNWTIKDELGNEIKREYGKTNPQITVNIPHQGNVIVSCNVTDRITNREKNNSKQVNVTFRPLQASLRKVNSYTKDGLEYYSFEASGQGGSGSLKYVWHPPYQVSQVPVYDELEANKSIYEFSMVRSSSREDISCQVYDNVTGETFYLTEQLLIESDTDPDNSIEFTNVSTGIDYENGREYAYITGYINCNYSVNLFLKLNYSDLSAQSSGTMDLAGYGGIIPISSHLNEMIYDVTLQPGMNKFKICIYSGSFSNPTANLCILSIGNGGSLGTNTCLSLTNNY